MRSLPRSLLRVLAATFASLAVLLGLAAVAITQPTVRALPAAKGLSSDPDRLRRHAEILTLISPRDSNHPENLERAAAYIRSVFGRTRARVHDQAFTVRGRTYRNVIAELGPETGPLLVVGVHYDAFGDFGRTPERMTTPAAPPDSWSLRVSSTAAVSRRGWSSWPRPTRSPPGSALPGWGAPSTRGP